MNQRFWNKVEKRGSEECWEWKAYKNTLGYGRLRSNKKDYGAHRYSWLIHFGAIPPGLSVLHRCDNRGCVNPAHLFLGTQSDNMRDMVQKKRRIYQGSHNANSKLTDAEVLEIRNNFNNNYAELSAVYSVTKANIRHIVSRKHWGHI